MTVTILHLLDELSETLAEAMEDARVYRLGDASGIDDPDLEEEDRVALLNLELLHAALTAPLVLRTSASAQPSLRIPRGTHTRVRTSSGAFGHVVACEPREDGYAYTVRLLGGVHQVRSGDALTWGPQDWPAERG